MKSYDELKAACDVLGDAGRAMGADDNQDTETAAFAQMAYGALMWARDDADPSKSRQFFECLLNRMQAEVAKRQPRQKRGRPKGDPW